MIPLLFVAFLCSAALATKDALTPNPSVGHWVDVWSAMPQLTECANLPPPPYNSTNLVFDNTTIRQTLRLTTPPGQTQIRVRLSNAFGLVNLPVTSMNIALPTNFTGQNLTGSSTINTGTIQQLTFSGNSSIIIPPGALAVSDPISFSVPTSQIISLSLYLASGQASQAITSHPGSRTTSWLSKGDQTLAQNFTDPSTASLAHWYFISAVDAWSPSCRSTFAIVGDSITDGHATDTNGNDRWPDLLYDRMRVSVPDESIINQAAGGNRVLNDGLGPNALSRIDRDVLSHSAVKYAMIFEGVNDIGTADVTPAAQQEVGDRLIQAFQQIITRVHAMRIPIFGATITPFGCMNTTLQPYANAEREKTRLRVNAWIRQSQGKQGGFDQVFDFSKVVENPLNTTELAPNFNSGDCLHPSVAGYQAIADSVPLDIFSKFENGVLGFQ